MTLTSPTHYLSPSTLGNLPRRAHSSPFFLQLDKWSIMSLGTLILYYVDYYQIIWKIDIFLVHPELKQQIQESAKLTTEVQDKAKEVKELSQMFNRVKSNYEELKR